MTGERAPFVYVIAGEASGDALGGALVGHLKSVHPDLQLAGIGGQHLQKQGLTSLFPMEELSIMGLAEVLPRIPHMLRRIGETADDILAKRPCVVLTIDSPDFCFRVAKRVRRQWPDAKLVHYGAPTVWAWRPGRAKKIAAFLDHILCLYPFEPPYFERVGLPATFVGHPLATRFPDPICENDVDGDAGTRLVVLPGSRRSELDRLLPAFGETLDHLKQRGWEGSVTLPTLPHLREEVAEATTDWACVVEIITDAEAKYDAFRRAGAALAASGTVALELAACGTPSVIAYKVSSLSAFIGRRIIKIPHVSLVNILLDEEVMPEFLQENFMPENVAATLAVLLQKPEARAAQRRKFGAAMALLQGLDKKPPAARGADVILDILATSG